jgi:type II secretory pathway pseudopilin PulG
VARTQSGFTVLELVISASLVAVVLTLALTAFDANTAVSRVQQDVAELRQSLRTAQREIARRTRMAGRGGLPGSLAVVVAQNVSSGATVGAQPVLPGTDVLTLRGAFDARIYWIDAADAGSFTVAGGTARLHVDGVTRSGFEQPLSRLAELEGASGAASPEPILLVSADDEALWAVAELGDVAIAPVDLPSGSRVDRATLTLHVDPAHGRHTAAYLALSSGGVFPSELHRVLFADVLEEYRYYVREDHLIAGDGASPLAPTLVRARMVPGTDRLHADAGASTDVADGVFDFQIALGQDLDRDGAVSAADETGEPLAAGDDEWRWNDQADDEASWTAAELRLVRFTLLGQVGHPDRSYVSPPIAALENHAYGEARVPAQAVDVAGRRYRRRALSSVVDLRNP